MNKSTEIAAPLSPWSTKENQLATIEGGVKRSNITLSISGSKSFTNRAIIIASAANGKSTLEAPLFADDSYWCSDAVSRLGAKVKSDRTKNTIEITGVGSEGFRQIDSKKNAYIGSAGTAARFLPGVIAAAGKEVITLNASEQMSNRPVGEIVAALKGLGANIKNEVNDKSFPLLVTGGSLEGGEVSVDGSISSQFLSGILICAPLAKTPVLIHASSEIVQSNYVRMTMQVMKQFGVEVEVNSEFTEFKVQPQSYTATDYAIEADLSTATCFFSLAAGTGGSITIDNIYADTLQPDIAFLEHLKMMGCTCEISSKGVTVTGPTQLKGGHVFDYSACSDCAAAMAAIAPFADDAIEIRGIAHIRKHECDRVDAIAKNLTMCGVKVDEFEDGLKIYPHNGNLRSTQVPTYDDHRIAMGFAVFGALGKGIAIDTPSCVSKTCPDFYNLGSEYGVKTTFE